MKGQPIEILLLSFCALLIGISKAGFGGGLGILVGPLLALVYPARESVGWMLPLLLVCDLVSLWVYWRQWDNRNVLTLLPGALVGIVLGTFVVRDISDAVLAKAIGGLAIFFTMLQIYLSWNKGKDAPPWRPPVWQGVLMGAATGLVSTLSHLGGILTAMYLLPQGLGSRRFVATTTLFFGVVNGLKVWPYFNNGMLNEVVLHRVWPYVPVVIVGTFLGVWLNRKVPGKWFAIIIRVLVFVAGVLLLAR